MLGIHSVYYCYIVNADETKRYYTIFKNNDIVSRTG